MAGVPDRDNSDDFWHLLSMYCVPGSVLSSLHALSHLIPTISLLVLLLSHFTDVDTETQVKNINSGYLFGTYCVSDTVLSILPILTHLILTKML